MLTRRSSGSSSRGLSVLISGASQVADQRVEFVENVPFLELSIRLLDRPSCAYDSAVCTARLVVVGRDGRAHQEGGQSGLSPSEISTGNHRVQLLNLRKRNDKLFLARIKNSREGRIQDQKYK